MTRERGRVGADVLSYSRCMFVLFLVGREVLIEG